MLDAAACSGCGGCMAACPQGAVSLAGRDAPFVASPRPVTEAALVCPAFGHSTGAAEVCLQALGLEQLAGLWLSGLRQLTVRTAECAACPDGCGLPVARHLDDLNALLADRGLGGLSVRVGSGAPGAGPGISAARHEAADPARRRLFGLGAAPALRAAASGRALARLQAQAGADALDATARRVAYAPRIDPDRCTGCDACIRICPESVLFRIKAEQGTEVYGFTPGACSGCALCMDVCPVNAIVVEKQTLPAAPLALIGFRCSACKVDVHVPASGPWAAGPQCPICVTTGHSGRSFQVMP